MIQEETDSTAPTMELPPKSRSSHVLMPAVGTRTPYNHILCFALIAIIKYCPMNVAFMLYMCLDLCFIIDADSIEANSLLSRDQLLTEFFEPLDLRSSIGNLGTK